MLILQGWLSADKKEKALPLAYISGNMSQPINTISSEEETVCSVAPNTLYPAANLRWDSAAMTAAQRGKWMEKGGELPTVGRGEVSWQAGRVYLQVLRRHLEKIEANLPDYEL